MKKAITILLLYDALQSKEGVNLNTFMGENDISLSTFRRYISDINYYLAECYSGKNVTYFGDEMLYKIT